MLGALGHTPGTSRLASAARQTTTQAAATPRASARSRPERHGIAAMSTSASRYASTRSASKAARAGACDQPIEATVQPASTTSTSPAIPARRPMPANGAGSSATRSASTTSSTAATTPGVSGK